MKDKKKICFWSVLLILLVILIAIFSLRTLNKYELWKEHEEYLKSDSQSVENWMHINLISHRSGITKYTIYSVIGIEESFQNNRKPLEKLCYENSLNCTQVMDRLNFLVESEKSNKSRGK